MPEACPASLLREGSGAASQTHATKEVSDAGV